MGIEPTNFRPKNDSSELMRTPPRFREKNEEPEYSGTFTSPVCDLKTQAIQQEHKVLGMKPWMTELQQNLADLPPDPLSNAEPEKIVTTHLVWDITKVDFEKRTLSAVATYNYNNKDIKNGQLVLDVSNDLTIKEIKVGGSPADYTYDKENKPKDKPYALKISIPRKTGAGEVSISYETHPDTKGIYWVDKEFTQGREFPQVYTIFQPFDGIGVIPGQFTPSVRLTWDVNATSGSSNMMVLSSVKNNPTTRDEDGAYVGLKMDRPVPLYLLSLHVGNFSYKPYDDGITGVYAEDVVIEKTYEKVKGLPDFMKAAEEVCGPYSWGRYSPIVLGPAYPCLAMEHPCMSSCCSLALEQQSTFTHELAHSWLGNDITNFSWLQTFWNEGFTTFIDCKISSKIWGEDYAKMIYTCTLRYAYGDIETYKDSEPDALKLCIPEPVEADTYISYGKGALFFFMLEDAIGEKKFSEFIQDYMKVFFQNTMSDERFLQFLKAWLKNRMGDSDFEGFMKKHKIREWFDGTTIPDNAPEIKSILVQQVDHQATKLSKEGRIDEKLVKGWDDSTQLTFFNSLGDSVTRENVEYLDKVMDYSKSQSYSIKGEWVELCAKTNYYTDATKKMICDHVIDRNNYDEAEEIAEYLCKTDEGIQIVEQILEKGEGRLFPATREAIQKQLDAVSKKSSSCTIL